MGGASGSLEAVGGAATTGTANEAAIGESLPRRIAGRCDLRRARSVTKRIPPTNNKHVAAASESATRVGVELPARADGCSGAGVALTAGSKGVRASGDSCLNVTVGTLCGTRYFAAASGVVAAACATGVLTAAASHP